MVWQVFGEALTTGLARRALLSAAFRRPCFLPLPCCGVSGAKSPGLQRQQRGLALVILGDVLGTILSAQGVELLINFKNATNASEFKNIDLKICRGNTKSQVFLGSYALRTSSHIRP